MWTCASTRCAGLERRWPSRPQRFWVRDGIHGVRSVERHKEWTRQQDLTLDRAHGRPRRRSRVAFREYRRHRPVLHVRDGRGQVTCAFSSRSPARSEAPRSCWPPDDRCCTPAASTAAPRDRCVEAGAARGRRRRPLHVLAQGVRRRRRARSQRHDRRHRRAPSRPVHGRVTGDLGETGATPTRRSGKPGPFCRCGTGPP